MVPPGPNLTKLKKQRTAQRNTANRGLDVALEFIDGDDHPPRQLQTQIATLLRHQTGLSDIDAKILNLLDEDEEDEMQNELDESSAIQDRFVQAAAHLQDIKEALNRPPPRHDTALDLSLLNGANGTGPGNAGLRPRQQMSRLPQLELPKFNGDPLQWNSFWDSYESSIHKSTDLSDVDKFNYLRSLLKGVASDAIAGLAITNANYANAIGLIQERFGQRQAIVNAHVEALMEIPKATSDVVKLRATYDACEIHIRGLQALGITSAGYGVLMTPIILSKIPEEIRLIITRTHGAAIGNLDQLRQLLKTEIEARELCQTARRSNNKTTTREHPESFTTGSLVSSALPRPCGICGDARHFALYCANFTTPAQRQEKVTKDGKCVNCLGTSHSSKDCRSKQSCRKCGSRHHTSLCQSQHKQKGNHFRASQRTTTNVVTTEHQNPSSPSVALVSTDHARPSTNSVLMQTALATVSDAYGNVHIVRLLFDSASQRTYISESLASKLSLSVSRTEVLSIGSFSQPRSSPKRFDVVNLQCTNLDGSANQSLSAIVTPSIACPIYRAPFKLISNGILGNVKMADPPTAHGDWVEIDILIGLDFYWKMVYGQVIPLPDSDLAAIQSIFGWLISGPQYDPLDNYGAQANTFTVNTHPASDDLLRKFWECESLEFASTTVEDEMKTNADSVLQRFEANITKKDGRYEVGFPWKEEKPELPTNYQLCKRRFRSLVSRLRREELVPKYQEIIAQQLVRGFIEPVESPEETLGIVHYIAHHPVIKNDRATTKVRVVYDASAKQSPNDQCLNDCIYTGPNLVTNLIILLLMFRLPQIALLADIEKAFLQVGLRPEDRDATRFLWLKDPTKPYSEDNIQTYRFRRVLFGATSSPFLLAATIRYHLKQSSHPIAAEMMDSFYVDNLIAGKPTVVDAQDFYKRAKSITNDAGMNLREWVSNSKNFMDSIPEADQAASGIVKVLGIKWQTTTDHLHVKPVPLLASVPLTKRLILQTISMVYDPLGLVAPIVTPAKVMIQQLWILGLEWDDTVPSDISTQFEKINYQLSMLSDVTVPRRLPDSSEQQTMHVFVDASARAYATVAYLVDDNNSALICCKSRVAPIKEVTIPRLELTAAVMGVKLASFIKPVFKSVSKVIVWSDSQVVLHWIRNNPQKQGIYVKNRLQEIQKHDHQFRYCPTTDNPADLPSRGTDAIELRDNDLWWKGPPWLVKPQDQWPTDIPKATTKHHTDSDEGPTVTATVTTQPYRTPYNIVIEDHNNLDRLLRITAYCSRFILRVRKKNSPGGPITASEYSDALILWTKAVQQNCFQEELSLLSTMKSNNLIRQLRLFSKDGIIRTAGRFSNADLSSDAANPILLPKNNRFTDLYILSCHEKLLHQGVRHTLIAVRQSIWLLNGRQQVRSVLKKCRICRLWESRAYQLPPSPPLPSSRVTENPAFTYTGCDFAGPLHVDHNGAVHKAWICIFTCAVTRALHLELVTDMTTHRFLLALRRFVSRRGVPQEMISDNAKTFKMSKSVLDRLWHNIVTDKDTMDYVASHGITWKFNVERAPWWGGFFERMVGLVKRSLIKTAGKNKFTFEEVTTMLSEIEAILNTRPLTYVPSDIGDGQPLCPNHFLSQANFLGVPTYEPDQDPEYKDLQVSANTLLKKLRHRQVLLDRFWRIWSREYLSMLREYHNQWDKKAKPVSNQPKKGEVVLIKEEGIKRAHWKLGIIVHLFEGNDGNVRAAQIRCKDATLQRPISLLYPLEIKAEVPSYLPDSTDAKVQRPTRQSAIRAKEAIRRCLLDAN